MKRRRKRKSNFRNVSNQATINGLQQDLRQIANLPLTLTFDNIPISMTNRMQSAGKAIIVDELDKVGYKGIWRWSSIERLMNYRGSKDFMAKCITMVKNSETQGIKIIVKTHSDRKSVYGGTLIPPADLDCSEVYQKLSGVTVVPKKSDGTPIDRAEKGEIYLGKISSYTKDTVSISIFPDNPAKYRDAKCADVDISHQYFDDLDEVIHIGQMVRVICTSSADYSAIVSRKILLPAVDGFNPTPDSKGKLSLIKFTKNDERIAIALSMVKDSIDAHSNNDAWERAQKKYFVVGKVLLEGDGYEFAPARFVTEDVRDGICRQWKAKKVVSLSGIMRLLQEKNYIYAHAGTNTRGDKVSIGYCMWEEGYRFLGIEPPKPKSKINTTKSVVTKPKEIKPDAIKGVRVEWQPKPVIKKSIVTKEKDATKGKRSFDELFSLVEELEQKKTRHEVVVQLLGEFDALVNERDELIKWLGQHQDVQQFVEKMAVLQNRK